jgi:hypothetical protein
LRHQPRPTSTWCSCLMRWRTSEWAWLGVACIAWIKMEQPARQPASNSAGQARPGGPSCLHGHAPCCRTTCPERCAVGPPPSHPFVAGCPRPRRRSSRRAASS